MKNLPVPKIDESTDPASINPAEDSSSIVGKSDKVGRPLIYSTSDQFMDYFGINSLDQLPTIKDFQKEENSIGDEEEV